MTNPHYMSRSTLADALEISESTVDEMVKRGVLPKPVKLSAGCVRWRWETVDQALASMGAPNQQSPSGNENEGVQRAIQAAKECGRGRAA